MTVEPHVEVVGLDKLLKKLDKMGFNVSAELKILMKKATIFVLGKIPGYPPPRPDQKYRRSGTLGRSYTDKVEQIGNTVVGKIGTAIVYSPWVVSSKHVPALGTGPQSWFHKDRWYTLQDVVLQNTRQIVAIFKSGLTELLRK